MGDQFILRELDEDGKIVIRDGKSVVTLDWWAFGKNVLLGLLAALVVPLFLVLAAPGQNNSIIKQLMSNATPADEWWSHLLVLMGFCIVAALTAQRFLQTLSERLLQEAKKDADDARRNALAARLESQRALQTAKNVGPDQEIDGTAVDLLKVLAENPKPHAGLADIAKKAGLERAAVRERLADLSDGGLVAEVSPGIWRLRGWGMQRARKEIGLTSHEKDVLGSIKASDDARSSETDLVKSLGLPQTQTQRILQRLERFGLIAPSEGKKDVWRLRPWGEQALEEAS